MPSDLYLYKVRVCDLHESERYLKRGRFRNYKPEQQDYLVGCDTTRSLLLDFEEKLDWISEQVEHPWGYNLRMSNTMEGREYWTFSNRLDAIRFKLTFQSSCLRTN